MQTDQKEYVISITSRDRVGIIHEVAGAISYMNGDLADIRQQVLHGYFTMILHVTFPAVVSKDEIHKRLTTAGTSDEAAIEVSIKAVHQPQPKAATAMDNCYVLTADGEDRIGFVATVTKFCKDNDVNILDLTTTVVDGRYIMILFIDLSSCPAMDELRDRLDRFAHDTDLNMVLQHYDIFRATNEIKVF